MMRQRAGYVRLPEQDEGQQQPVHDARFDPLPEEIPYGSVVLAVFLMWFGMASFILAWLHWTQELFGKEQAEIGFTIMGLLTFVPGFYHSRIAFYAWQQRPGYSWSDIPAFS